MNFIIAILSTVIGVYFALLALIYFRQSEHIYKPTHEIETTPNRLGYEYDSIMFRTADNMMLNGWFIPNPASSRVVLFFHGNSGNISHCMETIEIFHRIGLSTFIFDYRGYGNSIGRTTEQGTYLDAEAAWRYLVNERHISPDRIVIHGRSLGGAIASWLARQHTPKALVIESAFTSAADIAAEHFPHIPARLLNRFHYNVLENIKSVKCPVLILHSKTDKVIGMHHGTKLFEAANQPKLFLEITGDHYDGFLTTGQPYVDCLEKFINQYV